jgi:hypothetical protein
MKTAFIFLAIIACANAASHLACTPAEFTDPATLESSEAVCKAVVVGSNTAKAEQVTGDFDPNSVSVPGTERDGKAIFDQLLAQKQPSDDELMAYVQAIGMLAAPAVFFFVLNFCCCFCCTCCHTCCKLCTDKCSFCKCHPTAERPYGKCESGLPVIVWMLFSVLMFAFAIAGVVQGVYKMNDAVVNSVCLVDDTYLRFNAFLDNVKVPLKLLNENFGTAVEELKDAAVQDPQLTQNIRDIGSAFDVVKEKAINNKAQVASSAMKLICDPAWDEMIAQCESAKTTIGDSADEIEQTLIDIQESIQTSVVEASEDATRALADGLNTITDTQNQVGTLLDPRAYNLIQYSTLVRDNRDNGAFSFYGWVFIAVVFGLASIVGMRLFREETYLDEAYPTNGVQGDVIRLKCLGKCCACFGCCSWFMVLAFGISCALCAAIFLPIAAVGSDACLVIPSLPQKLGELSGKDQITQITGTCWNKTGNLFDGLKLNEQIKLDGINFDDFKEEFAGEGVNIDKKPVNDLRAYVEDDTKLPDQCFGPRDGSVPASDDHELRTATLNAIDAVTGSITFAEVAFNTNPSVDKLIASGEKVVTTVKCAVKDFVVGTQCYFLATTWDQAVDVLCKGFIGSLSWIGTSELLLAAMAIPYAITLLFIIKREGGHGPIVGTGIMGKDDEVTEVDAVEIEMGDKY